MSSIDDKLNEVLNIADEVIEKQVEKNPLEIATEPPKPVAPENVDVDTDFETGRNELYKMLEKGNTAIDGILNLAKEGEHPRAYEVAGQLIKTQSEIAQNLLDLQGTLKKIKEEKGNVPKNVTNALFVQGSDGYVGIVTGSPSMILDVDGSSAADVTINFFDTDSDGSGTDRTNPIASTVTVPADSTLVVSDKNSAFYLEEGDKITGGASANGDIQCTVSYEEIDDA